MTFVANVMNRHPAVLARMVATLQEATGGRLTLGIGIAATPPSTMRTASRSPSRRSASSASRRRSRSCAPLDRRAVTRPSPFYPLDGAHASPSRTPARRSSWGPSRRPGSPSPGGSATAGRRRRRTSRSSCPSTSRPSPRPGASALRSGSSPPSTSPRGNRSPAARGRRIPRQPPSAGAQPVPTGRGRRARDRRRRPARGGGRPALIATTRRGQRRPAGPGAAPGPAGRPRAGRGRRVRADRAVVGRCRPTVSLTTPPPNPARRGRADPPLRPLRRGRPPRGCALSLVQPGRPEAARRLAGPRDRLPRDRPAIVAMAAAATYLLGGVGPFSATIRAAAPDGDGLV